MDVVLKKRVGGQGGSKVVLDEIWYHRAMT